MLISVSDMLKMIVAMVFLASLIACVGHHTLLSSNTPTIPRFEEVLPTDTDFPVSVPKGFTSRRGYLIVNESNTQDAQRTISLPVIIIKASRADKDKRQAPILKLAGGPGISGLNAAAYPSAYPWTSDRDFIVMGQRGTEHAKPALMCPEYLAALASGNNAADQKVKAAKTCKQRYKSSGVNLSAYHSSASAQDIEALRNVLNVEKLSLYGGSYGTRLALTYARDFPNSVESMVLDSPMPHTANYDEENVQNFREAIEAITTACSRNGPCSTRFPNLLQRFDHAIDAARLTPWKIKLNDETQRVTDSDLVSLLNPASPKKSLEIPKIMDAIANRDLQMLTPLLAESQRFTRFAWGQRLSIWCSEAASFTGHTKRQSRADFASLETRVVDQEICEIWDVDKRPAQEKAPTTSSVPTLVIAGQFDHLTPPRWGADIISTLENSYLAVIPYGGHVETNNWGGDGCAMNIANAFFKDERQFLTNAATSVSCLEARQKTKFNMD